MKKAKLVLAAIAVTLLSVLTLAGDQLPGGETWKGSDSTGAISTTVTSSSSGNVITVNRVYTSPDGVQTSTSEVCALNSAGDAYAAPDGGEYTFDEVVPGNPEAYRYKKKDRAGNEVESGVISKSTVTFPQGIPGEE